MKKTVLKTKVGSLLPEAKVLVIFDPTDFDAKNEVKEILKMGEYSSALLECYNTARSLLKHNDEGLSESQREAIEKIKEVSWVCHE